MGDVTIGLLHPGEMGAAVGKCLAGAGHRVLWVPEGRSAATRERAAEAGLDGCGWAEMAARSAVIVSICPPHAALDVARAAAGSGFRGLYLDANAVSPATAGEVAAIVEAGGADFADGGIIGPPPVAPGSTRLYVSGPRAGEIRALFGGADVDARVVPPPGSASAVKMAYASWTKGSAALLLAARALARAEGAESVLLAEWALSQPGLEKRWGGAAAAAAAKGWRWVGEMEEIAAAMAAAGLPDGFHQAAAEIYQRYSAGAEALG
jgi:3-hydroxyisobutyrate dehydrogenase-like beta-hydroxyacid dehydrogenase